MSHKHHRGRPFAPPKAPPPPARSARSRRRPAPPGSGSATRCSGAAPRPPSGRPRGSGGGRRLFRRHQACHFRRHATSAAGISPEFAKMLNWSTLKKVITTTLPAPQLVLKLLGSRGYPFDDEVAKRPSRFRSSEASSVFGESAMSSTSFRTGFRKSSRYVPNNLQETLMTVGDT